MQFSVARRQSLTSVLAAISLMAFAATAHAQASQMMVQSVNGQTTTITSDGSGKATMTLPDGTVKQIDMPQMGAAGGGLVISGDGRSPNITIGGNVQQMKAFDMSQIHQNMLDSLKTSLGCSDEEWAVIQPKLDKLEAAAIEAGTPIGGLGPIIRMTSTASVPTGGGSAVMMRQQELRAALQKPDITDAEIKLRVESLRQARITAKEHLAAARKELTDLLTQRQEAFLIDRGILE